MKDTLLSFVFIAALVLIGCGKKTDDHAHPHDQHAPGANDPNKALTDSIIAVHDEVMPRLDDIYKLTESLKDKVASTPNMPAAQKVVIEAAVDSLNKASDGMMVWMRQFKPEGVTDEKAVREYLDDQMVKVTKVKTDILSAIEKGRALQ